MQTSLGITTFFWTKSEPGYEELEWTGILPVSTEILIYFTEELVCMDKKQGFLGLVFL